MHSAGRLSSMGIVLLVGIFVLALASTAGADTPIVNDTVVFKGSTESQPAENPCTGSPAIDYDLAGRGTIHRTEFANGDVYVTMAFHTDFFIDTIDPAEVDYSGHETDTLSFEGTGGTASVSWTFTPLLTGTDGTRLLAHEVGHITITADGDVTISFDRFSQVRGCPS